MLATALALVLTLGFTAGTTGPASAEVNLPWPLDKLFGPKSKTSTPVANLPWGWCWASISEPRMGVAPALTGGPLVNGIVVKVGLKCIGAPATNIVVTADISRDRSIVNKRRICRPPGAFWEYHCTSLAMRGPAYVMPDTYQGAGWVRYQQNGVIRTTPVVHSVRRWFDPGIYS